MTDDLQRGNEPVRTEDIDNTQVSSGSEASSDNGAGLIEASLVGEAIGQAGAVTSLSRPAPGQTVVVTPSADDTYLLDFDPNAAQVQVEGPHLVLGFDDDGDGEIDARIVFENLAAEGAESTTLQIGGVEVPSDVLVGQALALAGEADAPLDEVAAGPGGGAGGGGSSYNDDLGSLLDLLAAQGVIPPTELQFGLIEVEDEIVLLEEDDEAGGALSLTFITEVGDGEGPVTTFEGGFEDWRPNQDDCDTPSFPMQIVIGFTPADNEELESLTLSGIPEGAVLYVGGTDPANIVATPGGTSPLLTPADLASGIYLLPPEDSGDDIPLTVTANIFDPDSGSTATISGSATAIIDSVADNPFALFDGYFADGGEGGQYGGQYGDECSIHSGEGATDSEIEAFLGLAPGTLDAMIQSIGDEDDDAEVGSAIKTQLTLQAGDKVELTVNFLDAEGGGSYHDFAFITINGVVIPIGATHGPGSATDALFTGLGLSIEWAEESGYFKVSGTVEEGGVYELGIGVMNEDDTIADSGLLIDDLIVTRGEDVVFQDDFTSFENWEVLSGGFVAIVGDINTNEALDGTPTQGLLIASGAIDPAACGCEVLVSSVTYLEDNAGPVGEYGDSQPTIVQGPSDGEGDGGDCPDDKEPIFGAGFVAGVTDSDGSESLTKITIATTAELEPGGEDFVGLEAALSGANDPNATNFMIGDQVLEHGDQVDVWATFADGSGGLVTANVEIVDGVLTLLFDGAARVQSVNLTGSSPTPFQVRLPQHSDDDFQLNLEVTATEFDIDQELLLENNEATHQAVLNVEVQAVADGADPTVPGETLNFVEDDKIDPEDHGEDSGETGLVIPLSSLGAALIDKDGSEAITKIKISLEGADAGATFVDAEGEPLGATLAVEVEGGVVLTADVSIVGQSLELTFGDDAAGYDIDLSGLIQVQLPVDDSDDFTVKVEATTTEVNPEGDVACESKTTEESFDVHVGGVVGPAAIEFGDYSNYPGCDEPSVDGNTLTLSLFEDGQGSVDDQAGEGGDAGPLEVPVFFTAATQDNDGSEKITQVTLDLEGAPEGTQFVDGSGDPLEAGDEIAGATVSFNGSQLVLTFPDPGEDSIDLSGIFAQLPLHSDDDFAIKIKTQTTEYDDDGVNPAVETYETEATINVKVDAVADPVTVEIDAVSDVGNDENFAPGETGTVTVDATFGDYEDGSEVHTVTVKIPEGFTVTNDAGGEVDEEAGTVTWTVTGTDTFQAVLEVKADDGLTVDETVKWKAKAKAVEQNENTDPQPGEDAECTTGNNEAKDFDKDLVSLDPALPPVIEVSLQGEPLCIEEDGEGQFTVTVNAQGDDFVKQILVENLPGVSEGWTVSVVGSDAGDGGSFDANTGIYTTGGNPASVTLTITLQPPLDSDLDVATVMGDDISFTATAEDPDSGHTAEATPETADVNVDANADSGDDATGGVDDGDSDDLSVSVTVSDASGESPEDGVFETGETGSVTVNATFDDYQDGSEMHTVTVFMPAGFSYDAGTITGTPPGTVVDASDPSKLVFTVPTDSTEGTGTFTATFEVTNDSAEDGTARFDVEARAVETTTNDVECDDSDADNVAVATDDATATVANISSPEVALDLPGDDNCIEEDSLKSADDNQVSVTVTPQGDDLLTEIVLEGFQPDWTYDFSGLEGSGITVDTSELAGQGKVTITIAPGTNAPYSGSFGVEPPADSDVDHPQITATATVVDPADANLTATGDNTLDIAVDANADAGPGAVGGVDDNDGSDLALSVSVEDSDLDGDTGFTIDEEGVLHITASFDDYQDGSETHTITVTAPAGFSIDSLASALPPGVTVTSPSDGQWVFAVATDGSAAGTVNIDLVVTNDSNDDGDHDFTVEVKAEETNTQESLPDDVECDDSEADNVATITKQATATALDDTPEFEPGPLLVHDESVGLQSSVDDDSNGSDEDDSDSTIGNLPDGLEDVISDLSIVQGDIVGCATDAVAFSYGQNGPAASDPVAFSLAGQGTQSTLFASNSAGEGDGAKRPIYLYQTAANVIVGIAAKWDGDSWEDPDSLNDAAVTDNGDYVEIDESLAEVVFIVYLDSPETPTDNDSGADVHFVQTTAIWHDDPADHDESDGDAEIEEQVISVEVTDLDGDSTTGDFTVRVEDDGPVVQISASTTEMVVHDETPGDDGDADDTAFDDLPQDIKDAFDAVTDEGNDPDVAISDKDNGALGYAVSAGPLVDFDTLDFGADGGAATGDTSYALEIGGPNGTVYSGVETTEGDSIYLSLEDGVIVGRVDQGGAPGAESTDPAAFAIAIDPDSGEVYVAQWLSLKHPDEANDGNGFDSYDEAISLLEGAVQVEVTVTDADGDQASSSADVGHLIKFEDDGPVAAADEACVEENAQVSYDLLFTMDISLSMADPSGVGGLTRLEAAGEALKQLIDAYFAISGDVQIQLMTFSTDAQGDPMIYTDAAAAKAAVDGIVADGPNGFTNYEAALETAQSTYTPGPAGPNAVNTVYFLSDGEPTTGGEGSDNGISAADLAAWESFLASHGANAIAVGVGTGITASDDLEDVAYPNDTSPVIVNDFADLADALEATVPDPNFVSGNVLDNDNGGADGLGQIVSVTHDGVTYDSDSTEYNAATKILTITTDNGVLEIQLEDFDGNSAGDYTYTPNAPVMHGAPGSETDLKIDEVFTYVVSDGDGDETSADLTICIEDGEPTVSGNSISATVEEEHLPGSNEDTTSFAGDDEDTGGNLGLTTDSVSGGLNSLVDFGSDGPGGFSLEVFDPVEITGLTSGGLPISYVSDGETLTAFVDDGDSSLDGGDKKIFELTVNGTNYSFVLLGQIDELMANDIEDTLHLDFSSYLLATDGDGDTVTFGANTFVIGVIDDVPEDISPHAVVVGSNAGPAVSGALDFYNNVGTDKLGDVTFDDSLHGATLTSGGDTVTSGGDDILLDVSGDGHILTGYVESGDNAGFQEGEDTTILTVELNPDAGNETDDLYTVTVEGPIDTGAAILFDNFDDIDAGGPQEWRALDDPRTGADDLGEDILFTAVPEGEKVNASSTGVGVQNQSVNDGETIRVDFLMNIEPGEVDDGSGGGAGDIADLDHGGHYTVNDTGFTLSQVNGGSVDISVRALDADDDNDFGGDSDDAQQSITKVTVLNELGVAVIENATTNTTVGSLSLVFVGDGTIDLSNVGEGYQVFVSTVSGFDALEITAGDGQENKFDLGGITTTSVQAGDPIDLSFGVDVEDADGDTADGTIDVTVLPQLEGSSGAELLNASDNGSYVLAGGGNDTIEGSAAADKLLGQGGNDNIDGNDGDDTLDGGAGNDTLDGDSGDDILFGGDGDDVFEFDSDDLIVDGGDGEDTVLVGFNFLDLTDNTSLKNVEILDMTDGDDIDDLVLSADDVLNMTDANNLLKIFGDADAPSDGNLEPDQVQLTGGGWNSVAGPAGFNTFSNVNGVTVQVEDDVDVTTS